MQKLLLGLFICTLILPQCLQGQTSTFNWSDKTFNEGASRRLKLMYRLDRKELADYPELKLILDTIVDFLKRNPNLKVEIDNYSMHYPEQSIVYGQARAVEVADTLMKLGIDSARLIPRGWGVSPYPVASESAIAMMKTTAEKDSARSRNARTAMQNRRTEIKILSTCYGHEHFKWSDAVLYPGSTRQVHIIFCWKEGDPDSFDHPHYECDSNNYVYDTIIDFLRRNPTVKIEIGCHTDPQGSLRHNLILSHARAELIIDVLITKGIDSARMVAKGYGSAEPIYDTAYIAKLKTLKEKDAAYQADRRTVIKIL